MFLHGAQVHHLLAFHHHQDLHQYLCTMKLSIMSLSLVTDLLQFTIILNQYLWLELWNLVTS